MTAEHAGQPLQLGPNTWAVGQAADTLRAAEADEHRRAECPGPWVAIPVTEQELAGLRLRRPADAPLLLVRRREDGAQLLLAQELDRWAVLQLLAWRKVDGR